MTIHRALTLMALMASLLVMSACTPTASHGGDAAAAKLPPPPPSSVLPASSGGNDLSCKVAGDCEVKNVGNCCGYFPACVNKDSKVDPDAVRAECARSGTSSVCGWQDIQSCDCVQGQCQAVSGPLEVVR